MKAFIGDVGEFATLFDRAQTTVKWQDDKIYGQYLGTANRFDVKKVDEAAGFYVTYTDAAAIKQKKKPIIHNFNFISTYPILSLGLLFS